jgi:hypothetical protein
LRGFYETTIISEGSTFYNLSGTFPPRQHLPRELAVVSVLPFLGSFGLQGMVVAGHLRFLIFYIYNII